jgi:hypothetical protein
MLIVKKPTRSFRLIFCFLVLSFFSTAQNHNYFIISGNIISGPDQIKEGEILILKKDKLEPLVSQIEPNGRFRLELEYNSEYKLTFRNNDYMPKTVVVNTEIPHQYCIDPTPQFRFLMTVKLFRSAEEIDNLYSGNQSQRIAYSEQTKNFSRVATIYDLEYVEKEMPSQNQINQARRLKPNVEKYQIF